MIKSGASYDDAYLAQTVLQERLDLVNAFAQALTFSMAQIPKIDRPYKHIMDVHICPDMQKVQYPLMLTPSSAEHYKMAAIADTLESSKHIEAQIRIFSLGDVIVSGWGDIKLSLQTEAVIFSPLGEDHIVGGAVGFWSGEEY